MVKAVIVIGLAGSGKTLISYSIWEWFRSRKQHVEILNLDPGVKKLPYKPAIDIREYINTDHLMEKYGIGPNSALILAMDLTLDYLEKINNEIRSINPSLLIIDTPGQMEIFAFRIAGKYIIDILDVEEKAIIFVIDGLFVSDIRNFISNILLVSSVKSRFPIPMILVLNKIDLLDNKKINYLTNVIKNPVILYNELEKHYGEDEAQFLFKVYKYLKEYIGVTNYIPVSSVTLDNFDILIQAITRVLFKGEEYIEY